MLKMTVKLTEEYRANRTYKSIQDISFNLWEKYGKSRVYLNRQNGRSDGWLDLNDGTWHGTPEKCRCYDEHIADFMAHCTVAE